MTMGDFVASSSTFVDGWRPLTMEKDLESGAREGRRTMDFDFLVTGEQGLSMSDHFLGEVSFEKIPFRFDFCRALVNIQRQENGVSLDGFD